LFDLFFMYAIIPISASVLLTGLRTLIERTVLHGRKNPTNIGWSVLNISNKTRNSQYCS
jgi:hypothetical protein